MSRQPIDARDSRFVPGGATESAWAVLAQPPVSVHDALRLLHPLFVDAGRKTATFTAEHNRIQHTDTGGGVFTANLPPIIQGLCTFVGFKRFGGDTNVLTLDGDGTERIDGSATVAFSVDGGGLILVSDGIADWFRVASYP